MKILVGGLRRCRYMADKSGKRKRETITFEPDEDVARELCEIQAALGKARGIRSEFINAALRAELPNVVRRKLDALQRLAEAKKERR